MTDQWVCSDDIRCHRYILFFCAGRASAKGPSLGQCKRAFSRPVQGGLLYRSQSVYKERRKKRKTKNQYEEGFLQDPQCEEGFLQDTKGSKEKRASDDDISIVDAGLYNQQQVCED